MPDSAWIWSQEHGDYYKAIMDADGIVTRYVWGREIIPSEPRASSFGSQAGVYGHTRQVSGSSSSDPRLKPSQYEDDEERAHVSGRIYPTAGNAPRPIKGKNDDGKGIAGCKPSTSAGSPRVAFAVPAQNAQPLPHDQQPSPQRVRRRTSSQDLYHNTPQITNSPVIPTQSPSSIRHQSPSRNRNQYLPPSQSEPSSHGQRRSASYVVQAQTESYAPPYLSTSKSNSFAQPRSGVYGQTHTSASNPSSHRKPQTTSYPQSYTATPRSHPSYDHPQPSVHEHRRSSLYGQFPSESNDPSQSESYEHFPYERSYGPPPSGEFGLRRYR